MTEFVEGWIVAQILGEGTYGEVKLLLNRSTGSAVAMKIIDLVKHPSARTLVRKEALIHSRLTHSHIISYYGQRQDQNHVYMFLEYASGGELFDRIEPDIGTPQAEAQKYFIQLLSGVEYLHKGGIAHRDLKPENLLLDNCGNLKISDFGMATFFRIDGKERLLESRCGTLPYVAPEVLERPYLAEPADLWSCGIVLVALLSGELPWNKPTYDCAEYCEWKKSKYAQSTPWSKINPLALSLIRKMLVPTPSVRYTLIQIKSHKWYLEDFTQSAISMDVVDFESGDCRTSAFNHFDVKLSYSQPEKLDQNKVNDRRTNGALFSFSQPTQIDDLLVATQLLSSQSFSSNMNCLQKLVKRMTRFFVKTSADDTSVTLMVVVEKLGYTWKSYSGGVVTICTVDGRKAMLTFKVNILSMEGITLLDFRLSKGCGIEFKKCFMAIKRELHEVIIKGPTIQI